MSPRAASILLVVAVLLVGIGLAIESFRRNSLRDWAKEVDGTFLDEEPLSEAAAFPPPIDPSSTRYHNIVRYRKNGVEYVVAQYTLNFQDGLGRPERLDQVVCFIRIPHTDLPAVHAGPPRTSPAEFTAKVSGRPPPPGGPIDFPVRVAGFDTRFQVRPLGQDAPPIAPVAALFPEAVQKEMLASASVIAFLDAKGERLRLATVAWERRPRHRELAALAERLVAMWRP